MYYFYEFEIIRNIIKYYQLTRPQNYRYEHTDSIFEVSKKKD